MTEQRISNENTVLSEREIEILRLVATGATNQQIALQLNISLNTVKVHLRNIFAKIGVASRTEASLYAVRTGLVSVGPLQGGSTTLVEEPTPLPTQPVQLAAVPPLAGAEQRGGASVFEKRSEGAITPASALELPQSKRGVSRGMWIAGLVMVLVIGVGIVLVSLNNGRTLPTATPTLSGTSEVIATTEWHQRAPMDVVRTNFAVAVYDGKIYTIGGATPAGISGVLERYTPQSNTWTQLSPKPAPASDIEAVVIGARLYVVGGEHADRQIGNVFEVYDPQQDRWEQLPELPVSRSRYAAAAVDGKLYLFGGWDGTTYRAEVWMFDPDKQRWEERTPLPSPLADMGAVVVEGQVHLIGGRDESGPKTLHRVYIPTNDQGGRQPWQVRAPLPQAAENLGATTVASSIYAFDPVTGKGWSYTRENDLWQPLGTQLPEENSSLRVVLVNTRIHLLGTTSKAPASSFQIEFEAIYRAPLPLLPAK